MIFLIIFGLIIVMFGFVVFRGAPYVPSHPSEVKGAFEHLYTLDKTSVLVDVGSGDGLVLRIAVKYGARAIGIELNPLLVWFSRLRSLNNSNISVRLADFWLTQLPDDTTVVYAFAVSRDQKKLTQKLQAEANRLQREIDCITYGATLQTVTATKQYRGHHLYHFQPLLGEQA